MGVAHVHVLRVLYGFMWHKVCGVWCGVCVCSMVVNDMIDIHMERRVQNTAVRLLRSL